MLNYLWLKKNPIRIHLKEYCKKALAMIGEFEEVEVITYDIRIKRIEDKKH